MISAFPLTWPHYQARTQYRKPSSFGSHGISKASDAVRHELGLLGAKLIVVSTNLQLRLDGKPYSGQADNLSDPGVAVYFQLSGEGYCLPCDRYQKVSHNLWAIAKHVEAMRGMQRWGVASVKQQFAGFKSLAAKSPTASWWIVLGVKANASASEIESAFRNKARTSHPEVSGGSHEAMTALNDARKQGLQAAGGAA